MHNIAAAHLKRLSSPSGDAASLVRQRKEGPWVAADVSRAWASLGFRFRFAESQEQTLMVVEVPFSAQEAVEVAAVWLVSLRRQALAETLFKL